MVKKRSRREFLEISALGAGLSGLAAVASGDTLAHAAESAQANGRAKAGTKISVWVTAGERRHAAAQAIEWRPAAAGRPASSGAAGDQITLDPSKKFQEILGFGGAFTDATCYMFNQLAPDAREKLFHELFHPSETAFSVCRTCVGSSDFSATQYSFDDGEPDPDLTRFSIAHDRAYILPMLRQARQVNPDLFLFSAAWSPPGWMKFNGSMLGGSMRKFYLEVYARYLLKFLQGYAAEGVAVQAITPQNEVDTDQDGRMPACIWAQEIEIEFVRERLGPLLEETGTPTKIWILDHNYNLWGRAVCELEDAKLRKYCNAVAWHGYVGTADMMSRVHERFPEVEMYYTEAGIDYKDPAYGTDWCQWGGAFGDVLRNWCRSVTVWNLALDENGRPNIGPFPGGGTVTIDSQTHEITRSGQYWALVHYSRAIRRGARRFDSAAAATGSDLKHVAAENPDGSQAVVVTNPGATRNVELRMGNLAAVVPLEAASMTTLAW